jgi:hypothetical protein
MYFCKSIIMTCLFFQILLAVSEISVLICICLTKPASNCSFCDDH